MCVVGARQDQARSRVMRVKPSRGSSRHACTSPYRIGFHAASHHCRACGPRASDQTIEVLVNTIPGAPTADDLVSDVEDRDSCAKVFANHICCIHTQAPEV
jgi:hypothetical protein